MRKFVFSFVAICSLVVLSFAQAPVLPSDSLRLSQKTESGSLNKKTIVTKPPMTNWSRIKDLFR